MSDDEAKTKEVGEVENAPAEEDKASTSAEEDKASTSAEEDKASTSAEGAKKVMPKDVDQLSTPDFHMGRMPTPTKPDGTKMTRDELTKLRVVKKHKPERDSLELTEGETLYLRNKDGMGWAEGEKEDGEIGWFPLDKVEPIYDNPIGDVGTVPEKSALDHFINEAKSKKPSKSIASRLRAETEDSKLRRRDSLQCLLETRPLREQLVDKKILASEEATSTMLAAQKRLEKTQKKKKKTTADVVLGRIEKGEAPELQFPDIPEDDFDTAVLTLTELPLKKQMYHLSSYEDVVSGSTILHHVQSDKTFQRVFKDKDPKAVCQELVARNVIVEASAVKTSFATKYLYQVQLGLTEYSVVNIDKVWAHPPRDAYDVALALARELIDTVRNSLPNPADVRGTPAQYRLGLHLAELQKITLVGLSPLKEHYVWLNIFTSMVLYTHMKFNPPMSMIDRKYLNENCFLRIGNETLNLIDIEQKALQAASKSNWQVYFCMSDCTITSPATYLWTEEDYDRTRTHAVRYFLTKHTKLDACNYTVTLPKLCQRIWKDLELDNKNDLLELIVPMLPGDVRDEYEKARTVGRFDVKFDNSSHDPLYAFEEEAVLSPR